MRDAGRSAPSEPGGRRGRWRAWRARAWPARAPPCATRLPRSLARAARWPCCAAAPAAAPAGRCRCPARAACAVRARQIGLRYHTLYRQVAADALRVYRSVNAIYTSTPAALCTEHGRRRAAWEPRCRKVGHGAAGARGVCGGARARGGRAWLKSRLRRHGNRPGSRCIMSCWRFQWCGGASRARGPTASDVTVASSAARHPRHTSRPAAAARIRWLGPVSAARCAKTASARVTQRGSHMCR
jgi:hypothetical protein